jgi:hypothetical protein
VLALICCGYILGIIPDDEEIEYTPGETRLLMLKYCPAILNCIPGIMVPEVTLETYRLLLLVTESLA